HRRLDPGQRLFQPLVEARHLVNRGQQRLKIYREGGHHMPVESTAAAPGAVETNELEQTLLDVVASLTGYPLEMLDPDMDLEADLGIDSIKRVEILAAVQSRLPGLAEVNSSYIGSLRTLRNIIEAMTNSEGEAPATDCGAAAKPVGAEAATENGGVVSRKHDDESIQIDNGCGLCSSTNERSFAPVGAFGSYS
ncbi:MAG: hypothetical protein IIA33_11085, partial [Planctomycetes bacterium]|nr:hypothetical protein [Planctomycetota bacterium]